MCVGLRGCGVWGATLKSLGCVVQEKLLWQRFRQLSEEKVSFKAKVVEAIPVGVRVEAFGKLGFIPFSHFPFVRAHPHKLP